MGEAIRKRLKMTRFDSDLHEAFLNVLVTSSYIHEWTERTLAGFGITGAQYNMLRILQGGPEEGYPRCEIVSRMVDRSPDATRLIDRIEKLGFVRRGRSGSDRRLSLTQITRKGLDLLQNIESAVQQGHKHFTGRLSAKECRELSRLCEKIYGPEV